MIEDRELDQIAPRRYRVMEVVEFVASSEMDPVYLNASYYVHNSVVCVPAWENTSGAPPEQSKYRRYPGKYWSYRSALVCGDRIMSNRTYA